MSPDDAVIACHFLHAASLMLLWGGSAYLAWLVPGRLAGAVAPRLLTGSRVAVAIAIATSLAALPVEAAQIGEGWNDALDPATAGAVLMDTTVGHGLLAQALIAFTMLLPAFLPPRRRLHTLALTSGLSLASLALTGHAVMQQGLAGVLHSANDALHLLSGGAWLGALVPLLPILLHWHAPDLRRDSATALRRFSNWGHGAVAIVILTGMANMLLILGHLPTDWTSAYQRLLAAKIAIVAVMAVLALVNRYAFVPRLSRRPGDMLAAIRTGTIAEILLGIAAIACVACFGTFEPV